MGIYTILKRNWIAFALACVMVLALLFISESSYDRSVTTLNRLGERLAARTSIQELTRSVVDAETGQRGYMTTGRQEYRDPYDMALKNISQSLTFLNQHYAGDPVASELLEKLRAAITVRLSELALTLKLYDEGRGNAAREILLTDIGKEQMESIRKMSIALLDYETANVTNGRADIYHTLWLTRVGVAFLSVVGLLALYLYLRQTFALWQHQQELQRVVQVERDRLEAKVIKRTEQLTELAHHLQTAREDERHRLARNLHDDLGALLTSAKLDAARMRSRLVGSPPQTLDLLAHMVENLNNAIALGRRIIEDLRPSTLANLGLESTLEILAREFSEQSGVAVHCALEAVSLAPSSWSTGWYRKPSPTSQNTPGLPTFGSVSNSPATRWWYRCVMMVSGSTWRKTPARHLASWACVTGSRQNAAPCAWYRPPAKARRSRPRCRKKRAATKERNKPSNRPRRTCLTRKRLGRQCFRR